MKKVKILVRVSILIFSVLGAFAFTNTVESESDPVNGFYESLGIPCNTSTICDGRQSSLFCEVNGLLAYENSVGCVDVLYRPTW